ncbi:MAG: cell division protein FtsA [Gemmatimonadota bacterium]|nr:cell division protein FtsA [Gemmatimonadota bacterium]MDE2865254.1 cell division protein FtsA [Gemmatimonadota bacterium]MXV94548.1 cell division protein FtsA [Gemmatimonadota bacterium]MYB06809.1 cell division protein FtsA [Gemmatimonadota bacterium]MYE16529.1 cell division protein FtsA [Gemmatimonadota bacterium]
MRSALIAGLDVGSTHTRAVIGEYVPRYRRPELRVLGVGATGTVGVRKDVITDLDAATECIRGAVTEAEVMAGVRVDRVYVGVAGDHIEVRRSEGVVAVAAEEIVLDDVDRVNEVAQAVPLAHDRELIHAIPQDYSVDHYGGIQDPVGMAGTRLETELCIVTGCSAVVGNLTRAVERAGYRVQDRLLEPLAAARAVLAEDERELGVVLIDMGAASTGMGLYYEGKIRDLTVFPFGGSAITSDLIRGLSVPFAQAARIKEENGSARPRSVDPVEVIEVPTGNGRPKRVARRYVAELIEERLKNMFLQIERRLSRTCNPQALGAGVVITGGVTATPGIARLASECLGVAARIGVPGEGLQGLADLVARPGFATAAGLALYGADYFIDTGEGASTLASGVVTRVGAWLKEFF